MRTTPERVIAQGGRVVVALDYADVYRAADDLQRIVDVALLACIEFDYDCDPRRTTLAAIERFFLALGGTPAAWETYLAEAKRATGVGRAPA